MRNNLYNVVCVCLLAGWAPLRSFLQIRWTLWGTWSFRSRFTFSHCREQKRSCWWTKWCRGWSVELHCDNLYYFKIVLIVCHFLLFVLWTLSLQSMYTGPFTEEEFRSLGIMAPFVVDEVFIQLDRSFFINNLDFLRGLCYSSSKMEIVARILQDPAVFG